MSSWHGMSVDNPIGGSRSSQIWLESRPHPRPGAVQEHPTVGLPNAQCVTYLLRRATLDVPKGQHNPLVRRQRVDRLLEALARLSGQEPTLRGGLAVARKTRPVADLGRVVRRAEVFRADRGLRPADVIGGDHSERHRSPFAYGTGLRVVDEDAEDPGPE